MTGSVEVEGGDEIQERARSMVSSTLSPLSPEAPGTPCGQSDVTVPYPSKVHTHTK